MTACVTYVFKLLLYYILLQTGDYDSESCQVNERYRKVLEYGLPPCAEWTMEIDQMAMLLTDSDSLKVHTHYRICSNIGAAKN